MQRVVLPRNAQEERSSHLLRGGNLKSPTRRFELLSFDPNNVRSLKGITTQTRIFNGAKIYLLN